MMDKQLSRNFWLHEPPCWERATPQDVDRLQESVVRVAQPVRNMFGETRITSWMWWSTGCQPRTGTHSKGGTFDFQPVVADTREVFEWGATALLPSGYIGRWIYEPEVLDSQGNKIQGEHIHMAPRADMIAHNGDKTIKALVESPDGSTYTYMDLSKGSFADPYQLDPLAVTVRRRSLWWWLGLPAAMAYLWQSGRIPGLGRAEWA